MTFVVRPPETEESVDGETWNPSDDDDPKAPPKSGANGKSGPPPALQRIGDLFEPALERAERRRTGDERPVPVPFRDYSEALRGGYWAGVHTIVAGTGAGKSAFMLQIATHAAKEGVPVLYVGLELSAFQVALRALSEPAKVRWSDMYTGQCSETDLTRARQAIPELSVLPFYVEFNTAQGWAPSNLISRSKQIRELHPEGPLLVVLDFLQLVGAEPDLFGGRQPDVRERISKASYAAVHVANTFNASVCLISSAARDKYNLLGGDMKSAGLCTQGLPGHFGQVRTMRNPDALIGVGKESGEIEFAAESQTVLIKWPVPLETREKAVICAVPKLRYGPPRWVPMSFWTRFEELPFQTLDELPAASTGKSGRPETDDAELEGRVIDAIQADCQRPEEDRKLTSKNRVAAAVKGTKGAVLKIIDALLATGTINKVRGGWFEVVREPGATNQ